MASPLAQPAHPAPGNARPLLDVLDGAADTADCGTGTDTATADPPGIDTLTGCELPATAPAPGSGPETDPPETAITEGPKDKTKKKSATFEFSSTEPGSSFNCVLDDRETFKPCTSPITVKVKKGKHTFEVLATDAAGNADPTPASDTWKVKRRKKKKKK